jgi:hypothetical protein
VKSQTTNHDIQIGDVFRSEKGGRLVTVIEAAPKVLFEGTTTARMTATPRNFLKGRRLIERTGVRAGDVRGCGTSGSRSTVVEFHEGGAICRVSFGSDLSNEWFPLDFLSTLPLLERDGKAV